MKIDKAERRDKKRQKRTEMVRTGDSVKTLRNIILRKAEKAAREKEKQRDSDR
jgi:hypothetical protein